MTLTEAWRRYKARLKAWGSEQVRYSRRHFGMLVTDYTEQRKAARYRPPPVRLSSKNPAVVLTPGNFNAGKYTMGRNTLDAAKPQPIYIAPVRVTDTRCDEPGGHYIDEFTTDTGKVIWRLRPTVGELPVQFLTTAELYYFFCMQMLYVTIGCVTAEESEFTLARAAYIKVDLLRGVHTGAFYPSKECFEAARHAVDYQLSYDAAYQQFGDTMHVHRPWLFEPERQYTPRPEQDYP